MKIDRIEIQTSNSKHATDIAMLVEQDEFLDEIGRLREKWNVSEPIKLSTSPHIKEILNINNIILKGAKDPEEEQKRKDEFNNDIAEILKKFNKSKNFKSVVEYALATGTVPEGIFQSCYFDVVTINEPEDMNKPENYQYVIVLSPRTELQEVKKAYFEFKEFIKGKIQFQSPRVPFDNFATKDILEAIECIEKEKKLYEETIKELKNPEEIKKALAKLLVKTKEARNYLLSVGELDMDIPDHRDLIEEYHKGIVDKNDDIDKHKTLKQFNRNREFFLISYKDVLEGKSKKPLTGKQVYEEWLKRCPLNGKFDVKDKRRVACNCQYCTLFDINTIEKGIPSYIKFLEKL